MPIEVVPSSYVIICSAIEPESICIILERLAATKELINVTDHVTASGTTIFSLFSKLLASTSIEH